MKQFASQCAIDYKGVLLDPERFTIETIYGDKGQMLIRLLLDVATREKKIDEIPANWFEGLKEAIYRRWPRPSRWAARRWHPRMKWVVAMSQFPELHVPNELVGREFVTVRIVDMWDVQDAIERGLRDAVEGRVSPVDPNEL